MGLTTFANGGTLAAVQAVTETSTDVLEALVAKGLTRRQVGAIGETRVALLQTVSEFIRQRTEGTDLGSIYRRHCDYYLSLAEQAVPELERSDAAALMAELDDEVQNFRAALSWALTQRCDGHALRFATALQEYWERRDSHEGARWLREALATSNPVPAQLRASALAALAVCCVTETGSHAEAEAAARESLSIARPLGDPTLCATSLNALADIALVANRREECYRYASEAETLAREAQDEPKRITALQCKALAAPTFEEARSLGEEVAAALRRAGSVRRLALLRTSLTYKALTHGDVAAAEELTPEALRLAEQTRDPLAVSLAVGNSGLVALLTADLTRALSAFTRELTLASEHNYDQLFQEAMTGLAAVAAQAGDHPLAARLFGVAEACGLHGAHPAVARELEERFFGPARTRLGGRVWEREVAAGGALDRQDAVQEAHKIGAHAS